MITRMLQKCLVAGLLALACSTGLRAQSLQLEAQIDTTTITIGDQITYSLKVSAAKGRKVQFPRYTDTLVTGVDVIETKAVDTTTNDQGQTVLTQRYLISSYDSGNYKLPAGPIILDGKDSMFARELFLTVHTVAVDSAKGIRDIKLPYEAPITLDEILPWILIGLGVAAVLGIIFFIWWRYFRRKASLELPPVPKEAAHVIALRELEQLQSEQLWQNENFKQYHSRLTDIVRQYIEHRFEMPAMENTSDELLDLFRASGSIPTDSFRKLEQLLRTADLAKFAKYVPLPEENEQSFTYALEFVELTKIVS